MVGKIERPVLVSILVVGNYILLTLVAGFAGLRVLASIFPSFPLVAQFFALISTPMPTVFTPAEIGQHVFIIPIMLFAFIFFYEINRGLWCMRRIDFTYLIVGYSLGLFIAVASYFWNRQPFMDLGLFEFFREAWSIFQLSVLIAYYKKSVK